MMAAVARMSGTDKVFSPHGTGPKCRFPTTQVTQEGCSRVSAMGVKVVVLGNKMINHPKPGCQPHEDPELKLTSSSTRVSAEGKGVARIGDSYGEHPIISGCPRVFAS